MFEFNPPTAPEPEAPFPYEIPRAVHLPAGMTLEDLGLLADVRREQERLAQRDAELAALAALPRVRYRPVTPLGYYRKYVTRQARRQPYHAVYQALLAQRHSDYSESHPDWQPVADFRVPYDPTLRYVLELNRQNARRGRVVVINTVAAQYTRPAPPPRITSYPGNWRACVRHFLKAAED